MSEWKQFVLWFAQEHVDFRYAASIYIYIKKSSAPIEITNFIPFCSTGNSINPQDTQHSFSTSF